MEVLNLTAEAMSRLKTIGRGDAMVGLYLSLETAERQKRVSDMVAPTGLIELMVPAILERFGTNSFTLHGSKHLPKGEAWLALEAAAGKSIGCALRGCKGAAYIGYYLDGRIDRQRRTIWRLMPQ